MVAGNAKTHEDYCVFVTCLCVCGLQVIFHGQSINSATISIVYRGDRNSGNGHFTISMDIGSLLHVLILLIMWWQSWAKRGAVAG